MMSTCLKKNEDIAVQYKKVHALGNNKIENCFIRTQDDSSYVSGRGIKNVIYWNDSNGSTFVLSHIGGDDLNSHPLVIEDCTVVYARWFSIGICE